MSNNTIHTSPMMSGYHDGNPNDAYDQMEGGDHRPLSPFKHKKKPKRNTYIDDLPRQNNYGNHDEDGGVIEHRKPKKPHAVLWSVKFYKIGDVETAAEKYQCEFYIQNRWREPKLDGHKQGDLENWEKYWNPHIKIGNALGDLKDAKWYKVIHNYKGEAYIVEHRTLKGSFWEKMELYQFPFDTQDLTLHLTTDLGAGDLEFKKDDEVKSSVCHEESFTDVQEFKLHSGIQSVPKKTTDAHDNEKAKHPGVAVSCKVTRRFEFFLWNIVLCMIFITSLVYATFCVSVIKVENRLQLSFILLLSNISFKFSANQILPRVSYLTYLDKYILTTMGIQCVVCAWHAAVNQIYIHLGEEKALLADRIAIGIFLAVHVCFNAVFLISSKIVIRRAFAKVRDGVEEVVDSLIDNDENTSRDSPA